MSALVSHKSELFENDLTIFFYYLTFAHLLILFTHFIALINVQWPCYRGTSGLLGCCSAFSAFANLRLNIQTAYYSYLSLQTCTNSKLKDKNLKADIWGLRAIQHSYWSWMDRISIETSSLRSLPFNP